MSDRPVTPIPHQPPADPLEGFASRHPAVARLVRESLTALSRSGDPVLRCWADDVLAGRRSVRDLPDLASLRTAAGASTARLSALDDEQRAALAERGRAAAERLLRGDGDGGGR